MSEVFLIPSDRQPLDRESKVFISRPWFLFLQGLFTRLGGPTGAPTDEDELAPLSGGMDLAGDFLSRIQSIECSPVYQLEQQVEHLETMVSAQRDEIAALRKYVEGLAAGTIL